MKTGGRQTFRQIVDRSKYEAAESAWDRAKLASGLRQYLALRNKSEQATRCAAIKAAALKLLSSLLPGEVVVTIDDDYQVGLISVRWPDHGRLHLPADTTFESFPVARSECPV